MNHSIYSADRATHMKIVAVALISGTLVAGVGIAARVTGHAESLQRIEARAPVITAGGPIELSSSGNRTIR
jgi:hypothetical protein